MKKFTGRLCSVMLGLLLPPLAIPAEACDKQGVVRLRLTVTSPLRHTNTPLDPRIDFPHWIREAGRKGVLNPNSIEVVDLATNTAIPHALSDEFFYGDTGRVEFVITNPTHRHFAMRFEVVAERPALQPRRFTPQIGVGDLLRYNAGRPMPITVPYSPGLHDLDGDGQLDLTGCWNYAYRPGRPGGGVVCYRRTETETWQFGDLVRLRFVRDVSAEPRFFEHTYTAADFADFNRDGRVDLVLTRRGENTAAFYLNAGQRERSGMPRFQEAGSVEVSGWQACRAVDLDGDGAIDLVVDGEFIRNENPDGWPFRAAKPSRLNAGRQPCFLDMDGDGHLDAICLQGADAVQPDFYQVAWRRNLGEVPPTFGEEQTLTEIDMPDISSVGSWREGEHRGLIVQHGAFQELSIFRLESAAETAEGGVPSRKMRKLGAGDRPRLRAVRLGRAQSLSAVMSLSDQAWPCLRDWDGDGDQDLLVGGGYGWPRVVINEGTRTRPAFREPRQILSEGTPIRLLRNSLLGEPHSWHDMGYPYPDYVDWDGDGKPDVVLPNETNRIYWYRNEGTRDEPMFGQRRQILCDGFPDSPELRALSAKRAADPKSKNGVYPYEEQRPFFWRTGAALADFNGDGLADLVTHDGHARVATLFVQYRHEDGSLHLRKDRALCLEDGTPIHDAIVERRAHWTESFRAVDWNADGLQDLIYSVAGSHSGTRDGGSIYLLRNVGTKSRPLFAAPETMRCFGEPIRITSHGPHPWPGDFDSDGKPDLIACVEWSVYPYYSHAALMMSERPRFLLELAR